ncbi:hypothetical protein RGQ29_030601 [Quercus rubra]|uniref:TF-B3 domain-containing protein n=1 Tax=Quercus rubra TaxID=3512 RepID=A0AAN7IAV3_QUERU|nr:hypothetical protein RGQ29_030601 [Quercus rubra]
MANQRRDNRGGPASLTTKATHFFKIIMPGTLEEGKLWIPKKFINKYGVELGSMAFITIPNGTKWTMKLTKRDGEVWFQNGWRKFANCHALTMGSLLVFRCEGNSGFSILIFDATAIEIEYPLHDIPQVHRMEDNESDDNSIEIMAAFMPSRKTGEKPPLPCTLPHKMAKTKPRTSDLQAGDTGFRHEGLKSKGSMLEKCRPSLPHAIINYIPRKGFTKDHTKGSMLALYIYSGKYRSCVVSAGWFAFARENSLRVGDICIFELTMTDNVVFKVYIFKFVD